MLGIYLFIFICYESDQWVNGIKVVEHAGGHLPFLAELNPASLSAQGNNIVTVAVNNTLTGDTVPQGRVVHQSASRLAKMLTSIG